MTPAQRSALVAEWRARQADPLAAALRGLTPAQRLFVLAIHINKVAEGGNQSGKSWASAVDFILEALGLHPAIQVSNASWPSWRGWWASVSFELFGQQVWELFKRLLLFPGESVLKLPTRRILQIGWHSKSPEIPNYLKLRRDIAPGRVGPHIAEIWIKSFEQGRGPFQAGEINRGHQDEEGTKEIDDELQMRVVKRGGRISYSATPIEGLEYLAKLRDDAVRRPQDVFHVKLNTRDNPEMSQEHLQALIRKWNDTPEMLRLRLEGVPYAHEGLIYKDSLFTPAHVCDPFAVPMDWCRYLVVDHGWRHTVALWFAIAPNDAECVLYREYHGTEKTIGENVASILALNGNDRLRGRMIDRATLASSGQRNAASGEAVRVIDLYSENGLDCEQSPFHGVWAGVSCVWQMLKRRNDVTPALPWFRVFRSCTYFLEERRGYRSTDAREANSGDGPENPVKTKDHAMDAWRYFVVRGWTWQPDAPLPLPPQGTLARALIDKRRKPERSRL